MKDEFNNFNLLMKADIKEVRLKRSQWELKCKEGEYYYEMKEFENSENLLKEALLEVRQ